ncbi:hypothetical protein X970_11955 [Pseudomonas monteilii SB3101]|uniref:Uncharacterized protein n=1 Tax=Pseudomonas monteilii SB3101 TaxID=1435058 RepID=V9V058_9PSED|nr:hypothetical protein [Pseudomonas monteilii]AHC82691.1 hypothetical protein X969_12310 [Pseudomonas monteilii SB3078]AHC88067.1 hypothetical protein X970_11955 [Pseudomonas monteilii SB3101]
MVDDPIPLGQVYAAMEEHIKQAIPGLQYVGTMPSGIEVVPSPAVVLELAGFENADKDPGTGEVAVEARFEARVLVPGEEDNCLHVAAFVSAQLAVLLRMQSWGLPVEFAEFVRAERDWSRPELDGFAVWVVEWTQVIYLGEEEWPWPREPGPVLFGFDPDTGEGNEQYYQHPEAME